VPRLAADYDVVVAELELDQITLNTTHVQSATFSFGNITITVNDVTLGYSPGSLKRQRLETLDVDRVVVQVKVAEEAKGPSEPIVLPDPFELVPIDRVSVRKLSVAQPPFALAGELTFDSTAMNLMGVLSYEDESARASVEFTRERRFNASARDFSRGKGSVDLTGVLDGAIVQVDNGRFDVSYRMDEIEGQVSATGMFEGELDLNSPLESLAVSMDTSVGLVARRPRQLEVSGQFSASLDSESVQLSDGRFDVGTSALSVADQEIRLDGARVYIERLQFSTPELSAVGQARTHLMAPPVNFRVEANPFTRYGTFELSLIHSVSRPMLEDTLPGWKADYDLVEGEVNVVVSAEFAPNDSGIDLDANGSVSIREGAGLYGKTTFSGLDVTAPFTFRDRQLEIQPAVFGIDLVNVGLPIRVLAGSVEGSLQQLLLTKFRAEVLGGAISVDELLVALDPLATQFEVNLASISIADVLALEGDDISGHGTLDGVLPIVFSDGVVLVQEGTLKARAPGGHLAYLGNMPTANPGLDLAIRALRDFDYELLEAGADMAEDGELRLLVKLHGSSPNVENGRPIHFNLNVTENIPVLLESLRASQAMTDRVQERLRR
jgi:hypothetical protein